MKIVWCEFWIFFAVLMVGSIIVGFIRLPWWAGLLIGGVVGGLWPREIIKLTRREHQ